MAVTADTIRLISRGDYSVGAEGTITDSDFAMFLQYAQDRFSTDTPGNHTSAQADEAIGLLICHYIDRGDNDQHIKSEDAGDGSTSFDNSGSNWMKSYLELIASLHSRANQDSQKKVISHPSRGAVRTPSGFAAGGMPSSFSRW